MNNLALKLPLQERSGFAELVAGLSRKPNEIVAMLWAYFHESGEHSLDGTLTRLTIGGLIALLEAWQAFEMDWNTTLAKARLREFHGRTTPPQTAEEFTEIIGRHIPIGLGYTAVPATNSYAFVRYAAGYQRDGLERDYNPIARFEEGFRS